MEAAIIEVLKGVPVAAVLFYFAVQFRKDSSIAQEKYEALVNKTIQSLETQTSGVVSSLNRSSSVLERVERKLDEKSH